MQDVIEKIEWLSVKCSNLKSRLRSIRNGVNLYIDHIDLSYLSNDILGVYFDYFVFISDQVKKLWGTSKNISFVAKTDAYKWL